jgi:arabinogalactan oligomer/maltooligosaccharide transport system substrate-binding protein
MIKKLSLTMLTSSLLLSLVGCGGAGGNNPEASVAPSVTPSPKTIAELKPEEKAVLTVWDSYEEKAFVEAAALAFQQKYDVTIHFGEMKPDKAMEQMAIESGVGMGADVFASTQDHMETGVKKKFLRPIDLYKHVVNKQAASESIAGASYDGVLYGFPATQNVAAVYYNKDLVETVPGTWSEVSDFASGYNNTVSGRYALMWDTSSPYWNYGFLSGYGFHLFGKKGTDLSQAGLNGSAAVAAGDYFRSLRDSVLPLRTAQLTHEAIQQAFVDGKAAMVIGDSSDAVYYKSKVTNLATSSLPGLPGGRVMQPFAAYKSYFVNANSKYPNAARLFAAFLTSRDQQLANFKMTGAIPANLRLFEESAIQQDAVAQGFIQQLQDSQPTPSVNEADAYWEAAEPAFMTMWNDQTSASTALGAAVKDLKARLK